MTTSLTTSLPMWLEGGVYDGDAGNDLRNSDVTAGWLDTGILTGSSVGVWAGVTNGAALKVTAASGMNVTVAAGSYVVPNTASAVAGGYKATLAASGTLSVAASDPTNPRIDLIVAYVSDVGTSSSFGAVEIITGTPASSPTAPSAPANAVILAQVAVPANATSIVSGNIADERTFTAAAGGIVIAGKTGATALPAGFNGLMCYDPASGTFYHMSASGAKQAHVLPFAPVHTLIAPGTSVNAGTLATLASCSVTTDGNTDLKITVHIPGIEQVTGSTTGNSRLNVEVEIDSTIIDLAQAACYLSGAATLTNGCDITVYTSSGAGNTPSAGTHTVALKVAVLATGNTYKTAPGYTDAYLRVEPVIL